MRRPSIGLSSLRSVSFVKRFFRQTARPRHAARIAVFSGGIVEVLRNTHLRIVLSARRNFTAVLDPSLAVLSAAISRN